LRDDFFTGVYANFTRRFLHPEFQDGGRIPAVVMTATENDINVISAALACFRVSTLYKSEVETVPETGSTNSLTTETDIDATPVAIYLCFGGMFFIGVYANLTRCFLHPEILRWRTDTGSSYNFATENDMKVISAAAAMF